MYQISDPSKELFVLFVPFGVVVPVDCPFTYSIMKMHFTCVFFLVSFDGDVILYSLTNLTKFNNIVKNVIHSMQHIITDQFDLKCNNHTNNHTLQMYIPHL